MVSNHNLIDIKFLQMSAFAPKVRDSLEEVTKDGKFTRTASGYRENISDDHPIYKPEAGRYHLYISYACPWANRCLAMLKLKGLDEVISFSAVHPTWQKTKPDDPEDKHFGWAFYDSASGEALKNPNGYGSFAPAGCEPDRINNARFIRDLYELSNDQFKKYSVPVLWDKQTKTIVNNESSEIVRMFNASFQAFSSGPFAGHDFYPPEHQAAIDALNDWIYTDINDGVYKCGFAKSQTAYDEAVDILFRALDRVEDVLSRGRFLLGPVLSEADIRLFMTLVRFDEVYVVYFKCNVRRVADYPHIRHYLRDLTQTAELRHSVNMAHIKMHYFTSHALLNAYAVIPKGPDVMGDLLLPHYRNHDHYPVTSSHYPNTL